jgi:membrane protein implicated in regulation of membrane protease activity
MQGYVWWFVLGFALLIAELMTGTFYLMVIAIAFACAGIADLLGAPFVVQLLVAAIIGFGGSIWLRNSRFGKPMASGTDPMQQMDVGQRLRIEQWADNGTARANYRGAMWDVELAPGESKASGDYEIREVRGNRLIVARTAAR